MTVHVKRCAFFVVPVGALILAGCSSNATSTASASPSSTDPASCLIGSWIVNNAQFADAADDVLTSTAAGQLTGEVGLGFTPTELTTTYNATFTAKEPAPDGKSASDLKVEMHGGSSAAYVANQSTMSLSGGNSTIVVTATSTANGVTKTIQDVRPYQPLVSFSSGTVAYTCNNGSLFLTNQAGMVLTATRKA